jgi:hypothetical protein
MGSVAEAEHPVRLAGNLEAVRGREVTRVAVGSEDRELDHLAGWNPLAAYGDVLIVIRGIAEIGGS